MMPYQLFMRGCTGSWTESSLTANFLEEKRFGVSRKDAKRRRGDAKKTDKN
jgi:hypothetical protein